MEMKLSVLFLLVVGIIGVHSIRRAGSKDDYQVDIENDHKKSLLRSKRFIMPRPNRFGHMNRQHHSGGVQPAPRPQHPVENIDDQLKAIAHVMNKRDVRPRPRHGPLRKPQNQMQDPHHHGNKHGQKKPNNNRPKRLAENPVQIDNDGLGPEDVPIGEKIVT